MLIFESGQYKALPTIGFIDIAGAKSLLEVIAAQGEGEDGFRSAFAPITAGFNSANSCMNRSQSEDTCDCYAQSGA